MSTEGQAPRLGLARGFWPKLGLSIVIMAGFVFLLEHGALKLKPSNEALSRIDGASVAAYLVLYTAMHLLRCGRWWLLLAPVQRSPRTVVRVALVDTRDCALAFRMGEAARRS
jgi:uncharacterized membrane protein YbhN (UPF0104 family)